MERWNSGMVEIYIKTATIADTTYVYEYEYELRARASAKARLV